MQLAVYSSGNANNGLKRSSGPAQRDLLGRVEISHADLLEAGQRPKPMGPKWYPLVGSHHGGGNGDGDDVDDTEMNNNNKKKKKMEGLTASSSWEISLQFSLQYSCLSARTLVV